MDKNKLREIFNDIENNVLLKKIRELFKMLQLKNNWKRIQKV